jgi:hypothetical protein
VPAQAATQRCLDVALCGIVDGIAPSDRHAPEGEVAGFKLCVSDFHLVWL